MGKITVNMKCMLIKKVVDTFKKVTKKYEYNI